jgi:hypothetical protein
MQQQPARVDQRVGDRLVAWVERRDDRQQRRNRKQKDAERDGVVSVSKYQEGEDQEEAQPGERLMRIDGQGAMGCGERFDDGDEVEEGSGERCGHGDVSPARAVVECGRQHRECGDAVEDNRDAEPEEGHGLAGSAGLDSAGFIASFLSLFVLRVEEDSCQASDARNDRRETLRTLAFMNQPESAEDRSQRQNECKVGTSCLVRHVTIDDTRFQPFAVSALSLRHSHDALRAVGDDLVVLFQLRRQWQWTGK